jgi:hypothetical protein
MGMRQSPPPVNEALPTCQIPIPPALGIVQTAESIGSRRFQGQKCAHAHI